MLLFFVVLCEENQEEKSVHDTWAKVLCCESQATCFGVDLMMWHENRTGKFDVKKAPKNLQNLLRLPFEDYRSFVVETGG
jgi:hypothetical protein